MANKKITTVKNVITEKKETYFNNYSLKENMISYIISLNNQNSNLLNSKLREKYALNIEIIPSKKGGFKAYSQKYDLIAFNE